MRGSRQRRRPRTWPGAVWCGPPPSLPPCLIKRRSTEFSTLFRRSSRFSNHNPRGLASSSRRSSPQPYAVPTTSQARVLRGPRARLPTKGRGATIASPFGPRGPSSISSSGVDHSPSPPPSSPQPPSSRNEGPSLGCLLGWSHAWPASGWAARIIKQGLTWPWLSMPVSFHSRSCLCFSSGIFYCSFLTAL